MEEPTVEIDFTIVDEECLLGEDQSEDEPVWLPALRRSLNRLHHSQAALHRKADQMSEQGDKLVESVEQLGEKEAALEGVVATIATGVKASATALADLEAHIAQLVRDEILTPEQATALQAQVDKVGAGVDTSTQALTAAAGELQASAAAGEADLGGDAGAGAGAGGGETAEPFRYNFTGDPATIDATAYTKADVQGAGGVALYTFDADVAGEPAKGAPEGSGWTLWTGATEAIPAA